MLSLIKSVVERGAMINAKPLQERDGNSPNNTNSCGSGLARDSGGSVNINGGCADVIAGKPAPTGYV
jgi:hypothetical protein